MRPRPFVLLLHASSDSADYLFSTAPYWSFVLPSNQSQLDLNAPLSKDTPPVVTDATRLTAACPTVNFLCEKGAKVILASHLGRPKKKVVEGLKMNPVAAKLSELLGKEVNHCPKLCLRFLFVRLHDDDDGWRADRRLESLCLPYSVTVAFTSPQPRISRLRRPRVYVWTTPPRPPKRPI